VRVANRATPSLRPRPLSATTGPTAPQQNHFIRSPSFDRLSCVKLCVFFACFFGGHFSVGCFRKLQADVPAVDASAGSPSTIPTSKAISWVGRSSEHGGRFGPKVRLSQHSPAARSAGSSRLKSAWSAAEWRGEAAAALARRIAGAPNLKFRGCRRTTAATSTASGRRSHRMPDGPLGLQRLCGSESSSGDNHVGP
jgi:hypothetical protein